MSHFGDVTAKTQKQVQKTLSKRYRRRLIRYGILFANLVMLVGVAAFILHSPSNGPAVANNLSNASSATANATGALDQLSSADIAVHVARMTNLPQTPAVINRADSVNAQLAVTPSDDTVIAKPQVVATSLKSYKDIFTYVSVEGDTIPSVAAKFNITSDTVRWSNGLQGDNLTPGMNLIISPVNGVVYTVKDGDTVDTIAAKYRANKDQIIADNDAEAGGLRIGQRILIRDGSEAPVVVARVATASAYGSGFAWGGGAAVYQGGANGYDYGYCTWWAANRRSQIGRPIPSNLGNASTWRTLAQRAGFATGNVPQNGAVIWTPPRDYYGHVGFVESVNEDGSVNISEMNIAGWGVVSRKTISAAEAAGYGYIY